MHCDDWYEVRTSKLRVGLRRLIPVERGQGRHSKALAGEGALEKSVEVLDFSESVAQDVQDVLGNI